MGIREQMEREIVVNLLARKMYQQHCEHKGWEPRKRVDNWCLEYADLAVDFLGFNPDEIPELVEFSRGGAA